jgi:hypothetical protein
MDAFYWTATSVAGLIVALVVADYVSNTSIGEPIIPVIPLLLAGAIWLIGQSCHHIAAEIHSS